jgi:hypothetical protein
MSKWGAFLKIARTVAPVVLQFTPLAPISGAVTVGDSRGGADRRRVRHREVGARHQHRGRSGERGECASRSDRGRSRHGAGGSGESDQHGGRAIKLVHDAHAPAA